MFWFQLRDKIAKLAVLSCRALVVYFSSLYNLSVLEYGKKRKMKRERDFRRKGGKFIFGKINFKKLPKIF